MANQVFAVVEYDKCIAFVYKLVFGEAYFLNVAAYPDVYGCDILIDKGVVGYFVIDVSPEIVGGPGQSGTGYEDTYYIKDDVASLLAFQSSIFGL